MSKKIIIVAVFLVCLVLVAFYFLIQTKGVYYKSYSPDGQYSRYASVNNYFSYDGPFAKFSDKAGIITVYDEIEKKIVGSHAIGMISMIDGLDWDQASLTHRGDFSIELPREINANLIREYQKSFPVVNQWSLFLKGKEFRVERKADRLTVKDPNDTVVLKDIKYIAQINNDSVQVLNELTEIEYYNMQLNIIKGNLNNEPHILEICGNVSTYNLKIVENDNYYFIKKAVGFTSYNFDNYITVDSIHKTNVKDIYFLNKDRELTYDDNSPSLEYVIIDYGSYFGILEHKYGIQYFDKLDIEQNPIKVMRNDLYGYYNSTPTKYAELHPYEFNLAEFKDTKNRVGYVDLKGNEYYK